MYSHINLYPLPVPHHNIHNAITVYCSLKKMNVMINMYAMN